MRGNHNSKLLSSHALETTHCGMEAQRKRDTPSPDSCSCRLGHICGSGDVDSDSYIVNARVPSIPFFYHHSVIKNMSTFTSRSASQEIPRQFYSSLKKHIFDRLRELSKDADWSAVPNAVANWSTDDKQEELNLYLDKNPTARNNYRFTILRAVKTLQQSEGNMSMCMRAQDLDRINLAEFFFTMFRDLVSSPDVSDLSSFKSLRPSDRELLTEEIYRTNLYQVVYDMRARLVGGKSRTSRKAPSVKSRRTAASRITTVSNRPSPIPEAEVPTVRADDSASCAPSEVVSRVGGGLDAQILSLHQKKVEEKKEPLPQEPVRVEATPIIVEQKPPTEKPETVLDLHVPSHSTRRSKFSREPSRKKKPLSFFDTEVSRRTVLSRSEVE